MRCGSPQALGGPAPGPPEGPAWILMGARAPRSSASEQAGQSPTPGAARCTQSLHLCVATAPVLWPLSGGQRYVTRPVRDKLAAFPDRQFSCASHSP